MKTNTETKIFTMGGEEFSAPVVPGAGYIDKIQQADRRQYRKYMSDFPEDAERLRHDTADFLRTSTFPQWLEKEIIDQQKYDLFMANPERSAQFEITLYRLWDSEHGKDYDRRLAFLRCYLTPMKSASVEQCYLAAQPGEVEAIEDFFAESTTTKLRELPKSEKSGESSSQSTEAPAESTSVGTSPKSTSETTADTNQPVAIPA